MGEIQIGRRRAYADALRSYRVLIDDVDRGEIRQGRTFEVQVAPGQHELMLKIDWCRSETQVIDVAEGERVVFECGPNRMLPWAAVLMIFRPSQWIELARKAET